jgi:hypothetical protein
MGRQGVKTNNGFGPLSPSDNRNGHNQFVWNIHMVVSLVLRIRFEGDDPAQLLTNENVHLGDEQSNCRIVCATRRGQTVRDHCLWRHGLCRHCLCPQLCSTSVVQALATQQNIYTPSSCSCCSFKQHNLQYGRFFRHATQLAMPLRLCRPLHDPASNETNC